jgi:hypothetical protein
VTRARTIVLVPGAVGEALESLASDWVATWVLDPVTFVTLGSGSVVPGRVPAVTASLVGRDRTVNVDLIEDLATTPSPFLRVVAVNVPDELSDASTGHFTAECDLVKRTIEQAASSHNQLSFVNLIITESNASLLPMDLVRVDWHANVLAAPENRASLRSFDAFVRADRQRDRLGFALAHVATVGALWSGMAEGPFDGSVPGSPLSPMNVQRITVRGVLTQDFYLQVTSAGLRSLLADESPLVDPTIRAALDVPALDPLPYGRVDEATGELLAFIMEDATSRPLAFRPFTDAPDPPLREHGFLQALREFAAFSGDKLAMLPRWLYWRSRDLVARRTTRLLHGAEGDTIVRIGRSPFGDEQEYTRELEAIERARTEALELMRRPPATTLDGPDTYAHFWAQFRKGVFQLADSGEDTSTQRLTQRLEERQLKGVAPATSLLCPDWRVGWSPSPQVLPILGDAAETLPSVPLGWLDHDGARRWHDQLRHRGNELDGELAILREAKTQLRAKVDAASDSVRSLQKTLQQAEEVLALDEFDVGPLVEARLAVALHGVPEQVRSAVLPGTGSPVPGVPAGASSGHDDAIVGETVTAGGVADAGPSGDKDAGTPATAFDRAAAEVWRDLIEAQLSTFRSELQEHRSAINELAAEITGLESDRPVIAEAERELGAWIHQHEQSFAWKLVRRLDRERGGLEQALDRVDASLADERHMHADGPVEMYRRFVGHLGWSLLAALVIGWVSSLLQDRVLGDELTVAGRALGSPVAIGVYGFVILVLVALLAYHRRWSQRRRRLAIDRLRFEALRSETLHLKAEQLRLAQLHDQAGSTMTLMSEVLHRPFDLPEESTAMPSTKRLDPESFPTLLRLARPISVADGEITAPFLQRLLRGQLHRGWLTEAFDDLLVAIQRRHGVVPGRLTLDLVDRDPTIRSALLDMLIDDVAQTEVGQARVREVLRGLLQIAPTGSAPFPLVKEIVAMQTRTDLRLDLLAEDEDERYAWDDFLVENVELASGWSPGTYAIARRAQHLPNMRTLVHAPERFESAPDGPHQVRPRPDEIRPVELVLRIDLQPAPLPAAALGAFETTSAPLAETNIAEAAVQADSDGDAPEMIRF